MESNLIVTTSPHLHGRDTTRTIMRDVLIALTPAAIAAVVLHGWYALLMILATTTAAVLAEMLFNYAVKKKQTVGDLSAAVTGLLLALNLSTKVALWQCVIGAVFAIVVVKCLFGGIGCNFANPAITARIFLLLAFAEVGGGALRGTSADLVGGATPLEALAGGVPTTELPSLTDMLLGLRGGTIGEGCAIALIIGGIYLVVRRIIKWQVPVAFTGTVFLLALLISGNIFVALYHLLGGGLIIGAIFMATDYSTTPLNTLGKIVFAIGAGLITVLIRFFGDYPEGVSFAILLMNILSPYIEKLTMRRPLGGAKNEK